MHPSNHKVKGSIVEAFRNYLVGLHLPAPKRNALIDFLSGLPEIAAPSASRNNVVHGFIANGMVGDEKVYKTKHAFPDFDRMLNTVGRNVTIDDHALCKTTLPDLMRIHLKNGCISESTFDSMGYPVDLDESGAESPKTATITQESRQRAKCLSHSAQVELRAERKRELEKAKAEKVAASVNKYHQAKAEADACSAKLGDGPVTYELLNKATISELKAFIHARTHKSIDAPMKLPKKGKVEDARNGDDNLLKRAFDVKDKPFILEEPSVPPPEPAPGSNRHALATVVTIQPHISFWTSTTWATSYLNNEAWVLQVFKTFDYDNYYSNKMCAVRPAMLSKADKLQKQIEKRLQLHCELKVKDSRKRNGWGVKFVVDNIPCVVAIMVLFGHVKKDTTCLDNNQCLLSSPDNFRRVARGAVKLWEGCYLYWDSNGYAWIRTGKATGTNFGVRHDQHKAGAADPLKGNNIKSKFYGSFPSENAAVPNRSAVRGSFEQLQQHVGLGYNPLCKGNLTKDVSRSGIFHLDKNLDKNLESLFRYESRLEAKKLHMVGYLCEMIYDVCLSPRDNISGNPGMEVLLGSYA